MIRRTWPAYLGAGLSLAMLATLVAAAATQPELAPAAFSGTVGQELPSAAVNAASALLGAMLVARRPDNAVAKAFMLIGVMFLTTPFITVLVEVVPMNPGTAALVAWPGNWLWLFGQAAMFFMLFTFPTGRTLSRRWGILLRFALGGTGFLLVVSMLRPGPLDAAPALGNPLGVPAVAGALEWLFVVFGVGVIGGLSSLIVRFFRSRGDERLQLRWVAFGATVFVATVLVQSIPAVPDLGLFDLTGVVILIGAVAVAVTKYRLYEIDRLISRTVSYAVLTILLVGIYLIAVTALTALVTPAGDSPLAVAAATLAAAAAFGPARHRIQAAVDRRFNRARYDAARTIDGYRLRLRDDIDLDAIQADLKAVVVRTVEPTHVGLWLRGSSGAAP